MNWLNHQHLLYFWHTAQEGSVTAAAARLRLSASTVSAQIKLLEEQLDQRLFERVGRRLVLTAAGRVTAEYATDIFGLDRELQQVLLDRLGPRHRSRFRVGISNNLPKFIGHALLQPLRAEEANLHLVLHQGDAESLVAELMMHHLDLALTDQPIALTGRSDLSAVHLGQSPISLFGTAALRDRHGQDLPGSLTDAPFLLPDHSSAMRRLLDRWFVEAEVRPRIVAEFSDSSMLKVFGEDGWGLFPAPSVVAEHVRHTYRVEQLLELASDQEQFFALLRPDRQHTEPVQAVLAAAATLFAPAGGQAGAGSASHLPR